MNLDYLWVLLISAAPLAELRGGIPVALFRFDLPWYSAFGVAFVGNLLPVPFLILFLDPISRTLSRIKLFERMLDWVFERTRKRGGIVERYNRIGLVLLVGIPLPWTGAWTGSILAFLLGLKLKQAFPYILLGVLIAGVIVTAFCLAGWQGYLLVKES